MPRPVKLYRGFFPDERLGIFIDGANVNYTVRDLGFQIDIDRLLEFFQAQSDTPITSYYFAATDKERPKHDAFLRLVQRKGFTLVSKEMRRFRNDDGSTSIKANMDIELTLAMVREAPKLDHIVLFSGDGDFVALVEEVQKSFGVPVTLIASHGRDTAMILRDVAQRFISLEKLKPFICRRSSKAR